MVNVEVAVEDSSFDEERSEVEPKCGASGLWFADSGIQCC